MISNSLLEFLLSDPAVKKVIREQNQVYLTSTPSDMINGDGCNDYCIQNEDGTGKQSIKGEPDYE